ncbi:MAG TPA: hypothetical protein VLK24_10720 [Gaiellaceae bacterium]|nr:hypothetical protein [Gaiellaceae bacterium]
MTLARPLQRAHSGALPCKTPQKEHHMHATIRRYEGVDTTRMNEVVGKINETLIPQIRELSGFSGYYLIEADNGILSSVSLFESPEQTDESTKLVSKWISDENFTSVIPNAPKITTGKVVAHSDRVLAVA